MLRYIWKPKFEDGVWCTNRKQIAAFRSSIPLLSSILGAWHLLILLLLTYFLNQCNRKSDYPTSVLLGCRTSKCILSMSLMPNKPPSKKTQVGIPTVPHSYFRLKHFLYDFISIPYRFIHKFQDELRTDSHFIHFKTHLSITNAASLFVNERRPTILKSHSPF